MILDITSFGWSGSGAYHDLLREFDNVEFPHKGDWEFSILWDVDGIYDLENKLCTKRCRIYDSDIAINRFLHRIKMCSKVDELGYKSIYKNNYLYERSSNYINSLIGIEFKARSFNDWIYPSKYDNIIQLYNKIIRKILFNRITNKIIKTKYKHIFFNHNPHLMKVSYKPSNFLNETQDYIQDLIDYTRTDKNKIYVSDQMLPPDNPEIFYKYIKEPLKSIIVRRDPRDTYIAMKESIPFPYPIPRNVNEFIWFYKTIIGSSTLENNDNRLSLNFEDLIYEYDKTIYKLKQFVEIGNHINPKIKFNPNISKNNTQLFNLFPQYKEDVKKIEIELKEFLYPFENYTFNRTSKQIF